MRFMVIVKADANSEAGAMPSAELLTEMGNYNEQLAKAGVLLAGEGLHPSGKGARVKFSGAQRTVTAGPFAPAKDLVAGFWLFQVGSLQEAIEWVKRCPNPMPGTAAGDRDQAGVRGGRLRRRAAARGPRAGGAAARADREPPALNAIERRPRAGEEWR